VTQKPLTVGDLYCGAGGFSEGFRQAGFKISWAVDNWDPAADTYERNLGVKVVRKDVTDKDFDFHELPRVNVLIGSPPCQSFSLANRGGGGDASKGLKLVAKFLEAVKILEPDYWIMENVANLKPTLDRAWQLNHAFTKREVVAYFPRREILDSSHYEVPQRRKRLFSGSFPVKLRESVSEIAMGKVVYCLPYPLSKATGSATDPLYGIRIGAEGLTDHFMDTTLDKYNLRQSEEAKTQHAWAGKMSFPDRLDIPSRTVCATSQKSGRQAIVLEDSRGGSGVVYRVPTLREMASFQGFPITYQFYASSVSDKQTLIGNAVPPPIARFLALSILEDLKRPAPAGPSFVLPSILAETLKVRHHRHELPILRPYHSYVAEEKPYCRVELDNRGFIPADNPDGAGSHLVEWMTVLYLGYARKYAAFKLDFGAALEIARTVLESRPVLDPPSVEGLVVEKSVAEFRGEVPDATTLQAVWTERRHIPHGPDWILSRVGAICGEIVGGPNLAMGIPARAFAHILEGRRAILRSGRPLEGKDHEKEEWMNQRVDAYTACSALSMAVATTFANKGQEWLRKNWEDRYESPLTSGDPNRVRRGDDSKLLAAAR
jgi:site-specific DNA-cytosine methylase